MNEDLKAFVDGELSPLRRWLLARKIAADPQLQKEVEGLRRLSAELERLRESALLSDSLRARLLASAPVVAPARRPVSRLALGGALGGLVAASLAAFVALRPGAPESDGAPATRSQAMKAAAPVSASDSAPDPPVIADKAKADNVVVASGAAGGGAILKRSRAETKSSFDAVPEGMPGDSAAAPSRLYMPDSEPARAKGVARPADLFVVTIRVAPDQLKTTTARIEKLLEERGARPDPSRELVFSLSRAQLSALAAEIRRFEMRDVKETVPLKIELRPTD